MIGETERDRERRRRRRRGEEGDLKTWRIDNVETQICLLLDCLTELGAKYSVLSGIASYPELSIFLCFCFMPQTLHFYYSCLFRKLWKNNTLFCLSISFFFDIPLFVTSAPDCSLQLAGHYANGSRQSQSQQGSI